MSRYVFRLPDIGEGIAEAEIVAWHVAPGDEIAEDARVADVMTDKATVEMESPVAGRVVELGGAPGEKIAIGSPLVVIEVAGELGEGEGGGEDIHRAPAVDPPHIVVPEPAVSPLVEPEPPPAAGKVLASPAVRRRARDLGVDLAQVRPAQDGRVRHADLDAFLAYDAGGGFRPAGRRGADEQVRVIGLRRRIAENVAAAKRHIPHFSYVEEFDVTLLEEARAQLNQGEGPGSEDRPRLTLLPFLIAAMCRVLPDYPMLNAHYDDEAGVVTRLGSVHMGIATQTEAGLMVPVIRDAQDRNLWQLAREIARLAGAARDGSATPAELSGSSVTITSLGALGGVATTPVINRPEVMIVGPNRIVERPMFVRDSSGAERVEKRKLMNLSFSCDHRVVDGWDVASFAQALKRLIEAPALLLAG